MYIEHKPGGAGDSGPARIGRVRFSKRGRTLYYGDKAFQSLKGMGIGGNYAELATGEEYWISAPRSRSLASTVLETVIAAVPNAPASNPLPTAPAVSPNPIT